MPESVDADSPNDVWNSSGAQEIRRSILDGDYSYCSRTLCPMIANGNLPRTDEVTEPRLRRIIEQHQTILDDGPRLIALGHDSSCNLACPSCRVGIVMADKAQNERLDRARDTVILPRSHHIITRDVEHVDVARELRSFYTRFAAQAPVEP